MTNHSPTEGAIREYLLGRLNGQSEHEQQLIQQMFLNDELSEIADAIEDEIIEDYLDDAVSAADRRAIEEHFLRPAERKKKLQFALTLRNHFKIISAVPAKKKLNSPDPIALEPPDKNKPEFQVLIRPRHSYFRTSYEIAAAVLIVVLSLFYLSTARNLHSQLDAAHRSKTEIESELGRERERSTSLEARLQAIPPVVLPLLRSQYRDTAPVVTIQPWTQRIRAEVELPGTSSGNYDVRLETKSRQPIWAQTKLPVLSGALHFDIPTTGISAGDYCLVVSAQPEPYCFQVKVEK